MADVILANISIHTTTQVVTVLIQITGCFNHISIHTTTQVVTIPGGRLNGDSNISIHTTTQVVTIMNAFPRADMYYFNPHHHAGGDLCPVAGRKGFNYISIHTTTQVVT